MLNTFKEYFCFISKTFFIVFFIKFAYIEFHVQDKILNYESMKNAKKMLKIFKSEEMEEHKVIIDNFWEERSIG